MIIPCKNTFGKIYIVFLKVNDEMGVGRGSGGARPSVPPGFWKFQQKRLFS